MSFSINYDETFSSSCRNIVKKFANIIEGPTGSPGYGNTLSWTAGNSINLGEINGWGNYIYMNEMSYTEFLQTFFQHYLLYIIGNLLI